MLLFLFCSFDKNPFFFLLSKSKPALLLWRAFGTKHSYEQPPSVLTGTPVVNDGSGVREHVGREDGVQVVVRLHLHRLPGKSGEGALGRIRLTEPSARRDEASFAPKLRCQAFG